MSVTVFEMDLGRPEIPQAACISLVQTPVPDPTLAIPDIHLDDLQKAQKQKAIRIQEEIIRKQIKRSLIDSPDMILFPELTIPWDMQSELRHKALAEKLYIVGGLMYGPDFENACAVFPPFDADPIPLQLKLNRAPAEDKRIKIGHKLLVLRNTGLGDFAVVVCYDFTSLLLGGCLRDRGVDVLLLPTLNRSVHLFDDMATSQAYVLYTYICLCNAAGPGFGNSGFYGPLRSNEASRLQQERVICRFVGNQETVLTACLDIPRLRDSLSRFREGKAVLTGFITPPADMRKPGTLISPYTPMGPAKENFVCREKQIAEFWAHVGSNNHVILLGPSGTGKTSLIHRLRLDEPSDVRTGVVEVYDNEETFDFLRRLAMEISARAEGEQPEHDFRVRLMGALDDIAETRNRVATRGFEETAKGFLEAFHSLAQAICSRIPATIVVFVDQAERLAWLELDPEKRPYAIRILIGLMRDLETMRAPLLLVPAIRQHDYDPLIALACNHIPARIVALRQFAPDEVISAIETPLPPEITIDRKVSSEIVKLSGGSPFFVQLLADSAFKALGQGRRIDSQVLSSLNVQTHLDIFPLLMNSLTPLERRFVEAMALSKDYTVTHEDIIDASQMSLPETRHVADLLLGKNVVESLENARFRFVHDQMKGYVQREWLRAKMDVSEKLRIEADNALQMILQAPDDLVIVGFGVPPAAMVCFKSLFLGETDILRRIAGQIAFLKHRSIASLYCFLLRATYKCASKATFEDIRAEVVPELRKNDFHEQANAILTIEISEGVPKKSHNIVSAIDSAASLAEKASSQNDHRESLGEYILASKWAARIGQQRRSAELFQLAEVELATLLETPKDSFFWPSLTYNRLHGYYGYSGPKCLLELSRIAGELDLPEKKTELQRRALEDALSVIEGHSELAESHRERDVGEALELAWELGISRRKVIGVAGAKYHLNWAAEVAKNASKDNSDAARAYSVAAEWAERSGDKATARELHQSAVDHQLSHIDHLNEDAIRDVSHLAEAYAEVAVLANKAGFSKQRMECYASAIDSQLEVARDCEKKKDLVGAAAAYVQLAEWQTILNRTGEQEESALRAASIIRAMEKEYEKLSSLLLSCEMPRVAGFIRDCVAEEESDAVYFSNVASVCEEVRIFFSEHSHGV